jgi:hypothetical protein
VQQILHVPKRKRKPNIHHDGQTDDLGARLKVAKGAAFCHPMKLQNRPALLNQFSSDSAVRAVQVRCNRFCGPLLLCVLHGFTRDLDLTLFVWLL